MKSTISLKNLRNNPREFVRLLNAGYTVSITEHRKVLSVASAATTQAQTSTQKLLNMLPHTSISVTNNKLDTIGAYEQAKRAAITRKFVA